jgi:anti-anti-sigma factor
MLDCQRSNAMALARAPSWDAAAGEARPPPQVWREGTQLIVGLRGEQDMSTAAAAADALAEASTIGDCDVIVDLSEVQFMDASLVTVLLRARRGLRSQSRDLTVRSPSSAAHRVLDLCGLVDLIGPVPTTARPGSAAATRRGRTPATRRVQRSTTRTLT